MVCALHCVHVYGCNAVCRVMKSYRNYFCRPHYILHDEPYPRGSAQRASPCGSGLCDIFRPFVHISLPVVRGLAAVSGWTGLGAVMERFPIGQTLPATSLALEPM